VTEASDKRRSERLQTLLVTGLRRQGDLAPDDAWEAHVTDLSENGLFIETDARFSEGEIVEFFVHLPDIPPIPLFGVVRWRKDESGFGVEIAAEDAGGETRLKDFFSSLLETQMPYHLDLSGPETPPADS